MNLSKVIIEMNGYSTAFKALTMRVRRRLLGACEFHQWRDIMIVCSAQGCDVSSA